MYTVNRLPIVWKYFSAGTWGMKTAECWQGRYSRLGKLIHFRTRAGSLTHCIRTVWY